MLSLISKVIAYLTTHAEFKQLLIDLIALVEAEAAANKTNG